MAASSSSEVPPVESWEVFINFRGEELRQKFVSHLVEAFKQAKIKYFIDEDEIPSHNLIILYERIKQSKIALVIFSSKYAESDWCLDELVEIVEEEKKKNIRIIPVFFDVKPEDVKDQKGDFGLKLYAEGKSKRPNIPDWEKALNYVPETIGIELRTCNSNECDLVKKIVKSVKRVLTEIQQQSRPNVLSTDISTVTNGGNNFSQRDDEMDPRLKQLKEKINFKSQETQIVGILGMHGIGKTFLADKHYKANINRFVVHKFIRGIRENSEKYGPHWLKITLLEGKDLNDEDVNVFTKKSFVVLDDVSHKSQVDFLLENVKRIKKGSKIVIATRDKSSIAELVHDTYVVPGLNDKDALELFEHHAFEGQVTSTKENFRKLSKKFVDYARGNPGALEELGKEVAEKNEAHWEERLATLPHCCNPKIQSELRVGYEHLSDQQKDAFLDIACFFRSEEEDYVKCILGPYGSESGDEAVTDLVEKLLICISAGRIEMHNLLCTFGKELGSSDGNISGERMWNHSKITKTLLCEDMTTNHQKNKETKKVRGIFLDTSKVNKAIPVDQKRFTERFDPKSLRYLKVYDSLCPQNCKVRLPDGLMFPFEEIRYLHWQNFQLDELPSDFEPENLIDLRLPYSKKIQRVWEATKEVPRLKWVDLSYSINLTDLSALSKAFSLRRLNLEGCKKLNRLPEEMNNMVRLVFLNLGGCVKLSSLPRGLTLNSLKTLILSGCSNFNNFELTSQNLEFLHLDGTAIERLPLTIQNFKKLVLLNLKNCKMLESLPDCLDKLKALEELMLSGCSGLREFPEIKENMENMQILLLDGTSIKEVPKMLLHCGNFGDERAYLQPVQMNGLSMLRRLCLSRNNMICSLESCISELYHLKWIDLRYCKNLTTLLTLPPNLQYLNAHACISLKTVASPLALLMPTEQVSSSFIFTNCEKLEHAAKNEIICYAHNKSRLFSDAMNRHNKGLAFETLVATCFLGNEVPAWFNYRASGAVLEPELPPHRVENGFVGIALCAIVSFENYKIQNNNFIVKCTCEFNNVQTPSSLFNFHIGDLSETKDDERTIKSTHVFIGFTSWFNINQFQEAELKKGCAPTIKFEVTDGTPEAEKYKVLKCGFSLVCESNDRFLDANVDAIQDVAPVATECDSGSSNSNVDDANPMVREPDANIDVSSIAEQVRPGFWTLLRRWLFTL